MWKPRDGNFTNLSFVCRKTWRKGREQQAAGQSPVLLACTTRSSGCLQSNLEELSPRKATRVLPASRDMQCLFCRFAAGPCPSQRCKYWCWVVDWEQSDLFAPPEFSMWVSVSALGAPVLPHKLWLHFLRVEGKGNHVTRVKWYPRPHREKHNEETSFTRSSGAYSC